MAEAQQAYLLSSLFRIILRKNKRLFEMIPNKKMIGVSFVCKTPIYGAGTVSGTINTLAEMAAAAKNP
jgi:hypothetical protein